MTTRFKTSLAAGLVAFTMAATAPLVMAQDARRSGAAGPGCGGPPAGGAGRRAAHGGPLDFRGLDLTEDQQAQLKKIAERAASGVQAAGEKLGAARQGMRALIEAETIDESAIRAKSAEVGGGGSGSGDSQREGSRGVAADSDG